MRATLTLDPDVAERIERTMQETGQDLKGTVNEVLRRGFGLARSSAQPAPFKVGVFVEGLRPGIDPDKPSRVLDEMDVEESIRQRGR